MKAALFFDAGVSLPAFQYSFEALKQSLPNKYKLLTVNHSYFLQDNWENDTALIVFPGGRDTPYHERLKGEANCRIKRFIWQGGAYFGICAGAYYGSAEFEFEKGTELEILAKRELQFFPGKAVGPVYGKGCFRYDSEVGARFAELDTLYGSLSVYYNGGCYFYGVEAFEKVEVIGRYSDIPGHPPAIIQCSLGNGKALLSGVHPEYPIQPSEKDFRRREFFKYLISLIIT